MKIMKKIFAIVILSFTIINCKAQIISMTTTNYINIPNGAYVKDIDNLINPFVGTWRYINGNNELTILLIKKEMYNANGLNNYFEDTIMGGYSYVENGITIVNTLDFITECDLEINPICDNYAPILANIFPPFNELSIIMFDKIKNKHCYAKFELIQNTAPNPLQANFEMWDREGFMINGTQDLSGFTLTNNIILTKVN